MSQLSHPQTPIQKSYHIDSIDDNDPVLPLQVDSSLNVTFSYNNHIVFN